eukprot:TRINITY_DN7481_c0_g1_i1.p1 TRINITY_DN7481_c0_g1~~TRINITY_DN7481_c0_g1_i1.p1  ORF type:complete len:154 (-),score=36.20 TRINITY_DN7481_c0_g1_i1:152-613(-)
MQLLLDLIVKQLDFVNIFCFFFFFQAEDGIRDHAQSRGLGDVYKRQYQRRVHGQAIECIQKKIDNPCQICKHKNYFLIVMDINMPVMNGIEACQTITNMITQNIADPCLIVGNSGYADDRTQQQCTEAGMHYYIIKPLHIKQLQQYIQQVGLQ